MCKKFLGKRGVKATVLILFLFLCTILFAQKGQINDDKKMREEILTVFNSKGEEGLRNFVKNKMEYISKKFILDFTTSGVKEQKEEWLNISNILAEEKGDEKLLADVLYKTGEYFRVISAYNKSNKHFTKALSVYEKISEPVGQGNIYLSKGIMYFYTGEVSRALEMYEKGLTFFEKAKYHQGQGSVYLRKGEIYFYTGDNSRALDMYDKALPFFKRVGSNIGQGNIYWCKGNISLRIGDNSRALEMYDKALPFYKKAGLSISQGNIYQGKGNIYLRIGDNSRALEMYDKALPFYKKAKSHVSQGNIYLRMGIIYLRIGDNLRAFMMYDKALPFYEKARHPSGQGNIYLMKGNIYFYIGNNLKALKMYDKALPFFKKIGEPLSHGSVYLKKGEIYFSMGYNSKAFKMYDKALPFFEKAGEPIDQGNVYLRRGEIYSYTGNNLKAFEMYDKALSFFEKARTSIDQGNAYLRRGDIYLKTGKNSKALEMYNKALNFYNKAEAIEPESNALYGKAKVLAKLGKKEDALALFEKGIAGLEKVRTLTSFSDMKKTFMEKVYDQYEKVAVFMINNHFYKKAFKYTELMKSRVFLDNLAEGLVRLDKGISPELKQKRDNLVSKLSILSKEIDKAVSANKEKKWKELKEEYRKVEEKFKELLVKIRLENPLYASVKYPEPVSVQDLQVNVLKKKELLLRYFVSSHKVYVFLISKKNFDIFTLEINSKSFKEMVNKYLLALKLRNTAEVTKYGKFIYMKLFKPLEKLIKRRKNLIIVPDGELAKIPFEPLVIDIRKSGKPVYLVNKYRVKYVQSATVLSVLRRHYRKEGTTKHFIGFGDPVYDYENFKKGKRESGSFRGSTPKGDEIYELHRSRFTREGGVLNRLQASGQEVTDISKLFKKTKQKCVVYLRKQANENNAKSPDLNEFDYIHFSCHGILGDGFQSLVLSQIPESSEDGYLTLNEIMNCNYNARLVVLSACQTGSGKFGRGEGVTGLTRAVMYAGSPAVVASLWKVDDIGTKELMVRFYRNMVKKRMNKEEALRKARLELIEIERYSSPFYWGAFVMYGE